MNCWLCLDEPTSSTCDTLCQFIILRYWIIEINLVSVNDRVQEVQLIADNITFDGAIFIILIDVIHSLIEFILRIIHHNNFLTGWVSLIVDGTFITTIVIFWMFVIFKRFHFYFRELFWFHLGKSCLLLNYSLLCSCKSTLFLLKSFATLFFIPIAFVLYLYEIWFL